MKVAELTGPGLQAVRIAERAEGVLSAGYVRLRLRAASLNYRDVLVAKGFLPLKYPRIPLSDAVGEVIEVGEGVARVIPGDRVCPIYYPGWINGPASPEKFVRDRGAENDGVASEYLVISEAELVKVPDHLSDAEAATLPCAAVTAWTAVTKYTNLRPGKSVLIQGTGGVSLFALQFALIAGAETFLISSQDEKLDRGRQIGAHHTLNYRDTPEWGAAIVDLTHGRGVDTVVDVGGAETIAQSIGVLASGGHISVVGVLSGFSAPLPVLPMMAKDAHIDGIISGNRDDFEAMTRAIGLHELHPVLDRSFGLADIAGALEHLEGQSHFGKVTIGIS